MKRIILRAIIVGFAGVGCATWRTGKTVPRAVADKRGGGDVARTRWAHIVDSLVPAKKVASANAGFYNFHQEVA